MIMYGLLVLAAALLWGLLATRASNARSHRLISSQYAGGSVGWGGSPLPRLGIGSRRPRLRPMRPVERPKRW